MKALADMIHVAKMENKKREKARHDAYLARVEDRCAKGLPPDERDGFVIYH